MREGVKKSERQEKIIQVLKDLGGRAKAREIAKAAISRGDIFTDEELSRGAEKWAVDVVRRELKRPDEDGIPGALHHCEYVLDDDGETVRVEAWVQRDLWDVDMFMSSIRDDARGVEADVQAIRRLITHGQERWPEEDWASFQAEFSFLS